MPDNVHPAATAPAVSIVLITCNRAALLPGCVGSLIHQRTTRDWSFELIVVDDGSNDGTAEVLAQLASASPVPMRVLRTPGVGVPGARNLGFSVARGQWIASFDDDQLADPGWLEGFRSAVHATQARCFGGALRLALPEGSPSFGPRARALLGEHVPWPGLTRYSGGPLPATNNALIARDLFDQLGGFDTDFHQGGSDSDFFHRVAQAGEPIWFVPAACARHLIPPSRTARSYLRWTSLKVSAGWAQILLKQGIAAVTGRLLTRVAVILIRDLPSLLRWRLQGKPAATLDTFCSLWFTQGLFRSVWARIRPHSGGSESWRTALNFRSHNGERLDRT